MVTSETAILPRVAGFALRAAMRAMPVTVLMGARQTGKSTLVQILPELEGRPYLTLDDLASISTVLS